MTTIDKQSTAGSSFTYEDKLSKHGSKQSIKTPGRQKHNTLQYNKP